MGDHISDLDMYVGQSEPSSFILLKNGDSDILDDNVKTVVAQNGFITVGTPAVADADYTYRDGNRVISANKAIRAQLTAIGAGVEKLVITGSTQNGRTIVQTLQISVEGV